VKKRKSRARQRGVVHIEYLIVTISVSFVLATALYKIGPDLANHHHDVVTTVLDKAP